jgi:hypothetical protein
MARIGAATVLGLGLAGPAGADDVAGADELGDRIEERLDRRAVAERPVAVAKQGCGNRPSADSPVC